MSEEKLPAQLNSSQALAVFDDPGWFKSAWVAALNALIPLLGPVVIIGWGRELYTHGLTGPNKLHPVDFQRDLDVGKAMAPAILGWPAALMALDAVLGLLVWGLSTILHSFAGELGLDLVVQLQGMLYGGSDLASALITLLWIPWVLLLPELVRRVYQGEAFPWLDPGPSLVAIKENLDGYQKVLLASSVVLGVGWVVGSSFGWLALAVAPLVWSVLVHLSAQWQRIVSERAVPGTV